MGERSEPAIYIWNLKDRTAIPISPLEWESGQEEGKTWISGILVWWMDEGLEKISFCIKIPGKKLLFQKKN